MKDSRDRLGLLPGMYKPRYESRRRRKLRAVSHPAGWYVRMCVWADHIWLKIRHQTKRPRAAAPLSFVESSQPPRSSRADPNALVNSRIWAHIGVQGGLVVCEGEDLYLTTVRKGRQWCIDVTAKPNKWQLAPLVAVYWPLFDHRNGRGFYCFSE